jgi:uncharacterized repeat protein (TIGR03803 family)
MPASRFQRMCNFSRCSLSQGAVVIVALNLMAPLAPAASLTTLVSFNGANGSEPLAELIAGAAGNLYGTTFSGGTNSTGTVFRLNTATNTLTTLVSFGGTFSGAKSPRAGLVIDAAGNFYGTTEDGGAINRGAVFRLDTGTNTLTTLVSFDGANGGAPYARLIADAAGNIFGTTQGGGANILGTVFRLDTATNTLTTLVSFDGANGSSPSAGLIADAAGNLYGTTWNGGTNNLGTVFRLDAATNTLTTLASFAYFNNGANPRAKLIADADGNLYGTTSSGGLSGMGTIFRVSDAGFVVVPEPGSLVLLFGCAGWVGLRRVRAQLRCATLRG